MAVLKWSRNDCASGIVPLCRFKYDSGKFERVATALWRTQTTSARVQDLHLETRPVVLVIKADATLREERVQTLQQLSPTGERPRGSPPPALMKGKCQYLPLATVPL